MPDRSFEVIEPGFLTTVQDTGRPGLQRFGIPVSGAMDALSLRYGNAMLGNEAFAAGLECTALGPSLVFNSGSWVCVTGARTSPTVCGAPVPDHTPFYVPQGSTLRVGGMSAGMRAYVLFGGGIDVPQVMGSRSTDLVAHIGGVSGRALRSGDVVSLVGGSTRPPGSLPEDTVLPPAPGFVPPYRREVGPLRVILGPQQERFADSAIDTLLSSEYVVSTDSNRMGYRLSGPSLEHSRGADIVSDGIVFGAVQVPGHGQPIVLMADRQTTGGYTKIACVISADFPLLGQLGPGDRVRFAAVSVDEAHAALRRREGEFDAFVRVLQQRASVREAAAKRYRVVVGGEPHDVLVEDMCERPPVHSV
jgi:antagonist of KipI